MHIKASALIIFILCAFLNCGNTYLVNNWITSSLISTIVTLSTFFRDHIGIIAKSKSKSKNVTKCSINRFFHRFDFIRCNGHSNPILFQNGWKPEFRFKKSDLRNMSPLFRLDNIMTNETLQKACIFHILVHSCRFLKWVS